MKISTWFFNQGTKSNLSEKGQIERKDLIAKFLGITIFDTLHTCCRKFKGNYCSSKV